MTGSVVRPVHSCRPPRAGFCLYPDFGPLRAGVEHRVTTSTELAWFLLDRGLRRIELGLAQLMG